MEHHWAKLEHSLVRTKKRGAGPIGATIDSKYPTHTSRSACTPQPLSHGSPFCGPPHLPTRRDAVRQPFSRSLAGCPAPWSAGSHLTAVPTGTERHRRAPLNPHPATEVEAVPLCTLAAEGRLTHHTLLTFPTNQHLLQFLNSHARQKINWRVIGVEKIATSYWEGGELGIRLPHNSKAEAGPESSMCIGEILEGF